MATFEANSWVWFMHPDEKWLPGKVMKAFKPGEPTKVLAKFDDRDEEIDLDGKITDSCAVCDTAEAMKVHENMVKLNSLSEPVILHNLRSRFKKNLIYTYIGNILTAVNPFQLLPIYTPEILDKYKDGGSRSQPPHIYAIADYAYQNMLADKRDQSVVISGESGAGKTETMKLVLQFLAEASGRASGKSSEGTGEKEETLEEQVLKSNPVMEAFGNAKTTRNNNSSRFGKWTEILFNSLGAIVGGSIINYLLEKSRIPFQAEQERNYHIFYQILAGAEVTEGMKKKYHLKDAEEFHYLNQSGVTTVETINDEKDWIELNQAFDVLKMGEDEREQLIRACCAILHLGDLTFQGEGGDDEIAEVKDAAPLKLAAKLFEVEEAALTKCMTKKKVTGSVFKNYDLTAAADARDALSKALYTSMFDWIIRRINVVLGGAKVKEEAEKSGGKIKLTHIGVLDIFGFEFFETNSFEQLCINYCNEKLQFHFNEHIFKLEQKEYESEGIDVAQIEFKDNQPTLDLLEMKTEGIFAMVDEEINVPRGSDETLLRKVIAKHEKHEFFAKPKPRDLNSRQVFIVKHYAAAVPYNVTNFLDKNRDAIAEDISSVMMGSKDSFVSSLLAPSEEELAAAKAAEAGGGRRRKKSSRMTLGLRFKQSLEQLMGKLYATEPHFVRCMKPNHVKKGGIFECGMMLDQLRYAGLLEVCRIRQIGYPVRKSFDDFVFRYRCLDLTAARGGHKPLLEALEKAGVAKKGQWQIGHSKVFMRNQQQTDFEEARENSLMGVVTKITTLGRRFICRCRYIRYVEILKKVRAAMVTRTHEALDAALVDAPELPFGGSHIKEVRDARALKERLEEEARVLQLITEGIEARELHQLEAAVQQASEMDPPYEPAERATAEALIATIKKEKAAIEKLKAKMEERVKEPLIEAIEEGRALGKFVIESDTFVAAEKLKKRLDEEDAARDALKKAMDAKDYDAIAAAIDKMSDMGMEEELLEEGRALKKLLEDQAQARTQLTEAVSARTLDQVQAAIKKARDVKLEESDAAFAKGLEVEARLLAEIAMEERLGAAVETNTIESLDEAIKEADGMAPPYEETVKDSENLPAARKALAHLHACEECRQALRAAIDINKASKLSTALRRAGELQLDEKEPIMVEAAKKMEELGAQAAALGELDDAIGEMDKDQIQAKLKACQKMGLDDEEQCDNARKALKQIDEQDALAKKLSAAVDANDKDGLVGLIAEAEGIALDKRKAHAELYSTAVATLKKLRFNDSCLDAIKAALKNLDEEQLASATARATEGGASDEVLEAAANAKKTIEGVLDMNRRLKAAMDAKDSEEVEALIAEADEKEIDSPAVKEARSFLIRSKKIDEAKAALEKAIETNTSSALAEALSAATDIGLEGDLVNRAKAAQKKLDEEKELAASLLAAIKSLQTKMKSAAGLEPDDIAPLDTALDEALENGLSEDSAAYVRAKELKDKMQEVLVLQDELEECLKMDDDKKQLKALKKALDRAEDLDLQSKLYKRARARVRELEREKVRRAKEMLDADEFDEDEEEVPTLDDDEMRRAREEKHKKASHPKYHFTKYHKIRSPDDFARGILFNKRKVKAQQLRWHSSTINKSILEYMSRDLSRTATRIHKAILGYCGDRTMAFPAMLAQDILQKGLEIPELVDEIFVLLCKQLTHNPRPESMIRAWQLICMCVGTFPPSRDFENYLLNFILNAIPEGGGGGAAANYARYALRRLEGIMASGPSGFVPSVEEILAYKERPPILATIVTVDGSPLTEDLPITPDLNVGKVVDICNHFMELVDPRKQFMGIFVEDVNDEDEEEDEEGNPLAEDEDDEEPDLIKKTPRPLQNENFMGDIFTVKTRQNQEFRFVYKRKIFLRTMDEPSEDPQWEYLMYLQTVDEVIKGNIPFENDEEAAQFAASCMYADEEATAESSPEDLIEAGLEEYLPYDWRGFQPIEKWAAAVVKAMEEVAADEPDPDDVKAAVVERAKEHPLYGTTFFHVRKKQFPDELDHLPDDLILAFNSEGMHILDENKEVLEDFGYADIYRWGGSSSSFTTVVWQAALEATEELHFYTQQAADMAGMVLDSINAIMSTQADAGY